MKNIQTTQPQNFTPVQIDLPAPIQQSMAHYEDLRLFELTPDENGNMRPTISSLKVATKFNRKHKDVLRAIEALEMPEDFNRRNFTPVEYRDAKGEYRKSYDLTRDGFAFLAMGFTGKAATAWKIRFLECFNKMEAELAKTREQAMLQNLAQTNKALLASHAAKVAKTIAALPAMQKASLNQCLRYNHMGLNSIEIGKILGISQYTVQRTLKAARLMGMEVKRHAPNQK